MTHDQITQNNKKMKTAEEVIEEQVKYWNDGLFLRHMKADVIKAMKAYAAAAIEEQLKVAAKESLVRKVETLNGEETGHQIDSIFYVQGCDYFEVEETSITNCTRIELK